MQWSEVTYDRRRPATTRSPTPSSDRLVRRLVRTIAFRPAVMNVSKLAHRVEIAFRDVVTTT